jgi:hypothetical protein
MRRLIVCGLSVIAGSAWAGPVPLTGEALREEIVGSLLKIDTPLGVSIPVQVSGDGLVSGEAGPLASTLGAAQDRGRWWIDNDRLCVKWFRWFDAQTRCLTVEHEGTKIYWKDESGESGTATVTKSNPQLARVDPPRLIEVSQPRPPSSSPPPSSVASVSLAPTPTKSEDVEPLRFAAVDLGASVAAVASSREPEPNLLGAGTPNAPAEVESLPKAVKDQPKPPPAQLVTKFPKPVQRPTTMPSFRVTRVALDDALMIRSGPSEYHAPIGVIPPDGKGVQIVGPCYDLWCPVRHQRTTGWVNRYYLADEEVSSAAEGEQRLSPTGLTQSFRSVVTTSEEDR